MGMVNDHSIWSTVFHGMINVDHVWWTAFHSINCQAMMLNGLQSQLSHSAGTSQLGAPVDLGGPVDGGPLNINAWQLMLWKAVDHTWSTLIMPWKTLDHTLWSLIIAIFLNLILCHNKWKDAIFQKWRILKELSNIRWIKEAQEGLSVWRWWRCWGVCRCNGASEDAAGLSTKTRDVSPDRGVTIKMSRHWMRPLNTRIYAHYIPSCTPCTAPYNIHSVSGDASMHISHLFASLLRRHIWTFYSPFDTTWVVFWPPNICMIHLRANFLLPQKTDY